MIKSKTKKTMNNPSSRFNPARLVDQIEESLYATGLGKGTKLKNERQHRVDWLRKKYKDDQPCQTLANKLDACKRGTRCKSPACPECSSRPGAADRATIKKFLKEKAKTATIVCVSIVPADGITNPGQLSLAQHHRNVRRWKEALGRAGVTWFLGGSDWSFNEHEDERYQPHWSHHFYGFTATTDPEDLKKTLQAQFPKTDAIPRPVKVQEWDGKKRPIGYMIKSKFWPAHRLRRRPTVQQGQRREPVLPRHR